MTGRTPPPLMNDDDISNMTFSTPRPRGRIGTDDLSTSAVTSGKLFQAVPAALLQRFDLVHHKSQDPRYKGSKSSAYDLDDSMISLNSMKSDSSFNVKPEDLLKRKALIKEGLKRNLPASQCSRANSVEVRSTGPGIENHVTVNATLRIGNSKFPEPRTPSMSFPRKPDVNDLNLTQELEEVMEDHEKGPKHIYIGTPSSSIRQPPNKLHKSEPSLPTVKSLTQDEP